MRAKKMERLYFIRKNYSLAALSKDLGDGRDFDNTGVNQGSCQLIVVGDGIGSKKFYGAERYRFHVVKTTSIGKRWR